MEFADQNQKRQKPQRSPVEVYQELINTQSWQTRLNILKVYQRENDESYQQAVRLLIDEFMRSLSTSGLNEQEQTNTFKNWSMVIIMSSSSDDLGIPMLLYPGAEHSLLTLQEKIFMIDLFYDDYILDTTGLNFIAFRQSVITRSNGRLMSLKEVLNNQVSIVSTQQRNQQEDQITNQQKTTIETNNLDKLQPYSQISSQDGDDYNNILQAMFSYGTERGSYLFEYQYMSLYDFWMHQIPAYLKFFIIEGSKIVWKYLKNLSNRYEDNYKRATLAAYLSEFKKTENKNITEPFSSLFVIFYMVTALDKMFEKHNQNGTTMTCTQIKRDIENVIKELKKHSKIVISKKTDGSFAMIEDVLNNLEVFVKRLNMKLKPKKNDAEAIKKMEISNVILQCFPMSRFYIENVINKVNEDIEYDYLKNNYMTFCRDYLKLKTEVEANNKRSVEKRKDFDIKQKIFAMLESLVVFCSDEINRELFEDLYYLTSRLTK